MLNRNCVKWFEAVNWSKRFTVFLEDAKPSGTIGRIRRLIYSSGDFMPYDFADFLVYTRRYGDVALNPRSVGHDREFYWREEVRSKSTSFRIVPCEAFILFAHKIVHEITFLGPQKSFGMSFVDTLTSFFSISACGGKGRWCRCKRRHFG
jgi:hypothetical protein